MRRRRPSRPAISRAARVAVERLEGRTLLTTMTGGDVLEFLDPNNNIIRVAMNGSVTDNAEMIGATLDENNQTVLHNLSGTLNGLNVRGGIGGRIGVQVIGGTGQGAIRGLATNSAGATYGLTVFTPVPPPGGGELSKQVRLLQINNATGNATIAFDLAGQLPADPNTGDGDPPGDNAALSTIAAVTAADFDPNNPNLLYFVAVDDTPSLDGGGGGGGQDNEGPRSRLYRVDVTTGTVTNIPGAFGTDAVDDEGEPVDDREIDIRSISFNSAGDLWAYFVDGDEGRIAEISTVANNGRPGGVAVTLDNEDVTNITGIEFLPTDAQLPNNNPAFPVIDGGGDNFLFAVTPGGRLLHVDVGTGRSTSFGGLDPEGGGNGGKNLQGLGFNPSLPNPFYDGPGPAPVGTLLGTDETTNQLVAIDTRARYEFATLYQVYVASSTRATSISVALVPPLDANQRPMQPFNGNVQLRVTPTAVPPTSIIVNSNDGTGSALLGAVTRDLTDAPDDDLRPVETASLAAPLGVAPLGAYTPGFTVLTGNDFGRFQFGGTVTGQVIVGGSIDLFYAGWLVTGATSGQGIGNPIVANNFNVVGDMGALIVLDSIGTDSVNQGGAQYNTGVDVEVGGEVGHVQTGESMLGSVQVRNANRGIDPGLATPEFETRFGPGFQAGGLQTALAFNDSLDNPMYLNTIGGDDAFGYVSVDGLYEIDPNSNAPEPADTYAVGLLAGQTYTVGLVSRDGLGIVPSISVYDPDGRLIKSDASNFGVNGGQPFRFTTDRPGVYKFQLTSGVRIPIAYNLTVRGVGNVALGGVAAAADIYNARADDASYVTQQGDIGSIFAGDSIGFAGSVGLFDLGTPDNTGLEDVRVDDGNLRSVSGATIGFATNDTVGAGGVNLDVSATIGLLEARTGLMNIRSAYTGTDIQLASAAGTAYVKFAAGAAIGVVRAANFASSPAPSQFRANSDNVGFDGVIGLIDCATGDFGVNGLGGPQIFTGQGGNVRYIHVPNGTVYQDALFGTGAPIGTRGETTHEPAQEITITDDGGGTIRFTPIGARTANPLFDPENVDPFNPQTEFLGPQLELITYGIRGSGGNVVVDARVSGTNVQGIRVTGADDGNGSVEIGTVNVSASSTALTLNADGLPVYPGGTGRLATRRKGPLLLDANGQPIRNSGSSSAPLVVGEDGTLANGSLVAITVAGLGTDASPVVVEYAGNTRVDVLETRVANVTRVINTSGGEMPIVRGTSIGEIVSRTSIGIGSPVAGAVVNPTEILGNAYPFIGLRTGVVATNVGSIRSDQAVGNINVSGAVSEVIANANAQETPGRFDGITGPVFTGGNLGFVQIGEGLAPSGSGAMADSGLFSNAIIYQVAGQGGADIYGDIVAAVRIESIELTNGSIINSDIAVAAPLATISSEILGGQVVLTSNPGTISNRAPTLGAITLRGDGGIIGSQIVAADIGTVRVDGFGIFNSIFDGLSLGRYKTISAGNYGLRNVAISSGGQLDNLLATGNGQNVSTANFSQSVRYSETQPFDANFGTSFDPILNVPPSILTDIHAILGTSASAPIIEGVTDTGVMENVNAVGALGLGRAQAYQIRTRDTTLLPTRPVAFTTQFNYARSIGTIRTTDRIDGLSITTGRLGTFAPGSDVFRFLATVSGKIRSIRINGSLGDNSEINAIGPNATIGNVYIDGDLDGTLRATSRIGSIYVRGKTTGQIVVDNLNGGTNITMLTAAGGIGPENLSINGSIGKIVVGSGSGLGTVGGTLTVNGNLGTVQINGGPIDTNVTVNGNLKTVDIKGTLVGDLLVTGDVGKIAVANIAGATFDSVQGDIAIRGKLGSFTVKGGNVAGEVNVAGDIGSFSQTNGGIGRFDTVTNALVFAGKAFAAGGQFRSFKTTGSVLASLGAGTFGKVTIGGDFGNGVDAITATSQGNWALFNVRGSIRSGTTTSVAGTLDSLVVGGNVEAGAVVAAAAINRKNIGGAVSGTVTP